MAEASYIPDYRCEECGWQFAYLDKPTARTFRLRAKCGNSYCSRHEVEYWLPVVRVGIERIVTHA